MLKTAFRLLLTITGFLYTLSYPVRWMYIQVILTFRVCFCDTEWEQEQKDRDREKRREIAQLQCSLCGDTCYECSGCPTWADL